MNNRRKTPLTESEKNTLENLQRIWRAKRKELGLTQEKAAHELGWSAQAVVSQYLTGKITLGFEVGLKFAKLLRVQPSELNPEWAEYDAPDTELMTPEQYEIWLMIKDMDQEQLAHIKAQMNLSLPLLKKGKSE